MTPLIKQRIEQIRRGEVPEGYKKTKVGIVPAEWNIARFEQMFDRLLRKNVEGNSNVLTISAQFGLVSQKEFFNKSVASDDKSNYFLLYKGNYAYNKSYSNGYPFGTIKRLDNYEKGIVSPLYICFAASEENKCPEYYLQYFEAGNLNSEIKAIAQEGARNHGLLNISIDDFFNIALIEPPLREQEKIAEILDTQDRVIELYEKKIEQLQKLKKVFLQKMFPKPGASAPEWRFPGFSGAWEMRRFGDFMAEFSNKTKKENEYPLLSSTNKGMELRNGRVSGESNIGYKIIEDEDLVLSPQNLWLGNINVNRIGKGIVSPSYKTFKITGVFTSFVEAQLKRKHFLEVYKNASTLGASVVRRNLDMDLFFEIEMLFPSPIEQKKVGDFFASIDNLITLHQRKCDEEKKKKKALMQLLLTGIVRVKV